MRKKWLSILLAASMTASLLAGCGNSTDTTESVSTESTESETGTEETVSVPHGRTAPSNGGPITASYEATLPTDVENADIYVEKIDGISDDFIKGMDISSLLSEEESGVKYYNKDGEEEDLLKILADAGVNYVRVRVWNDPYDADGNGYGGGNCDAATAAIIGARAAEYGIKLCVDFHYSDFWADPNKQMVPKEWEGLEVDEKADKLYAYTLVSLNTIIDAGANVGMVQIGNEINYGIAGEESLESKLTLLKAGSKAVREAADAWNQDIQIAVHFTEVDNPDRILQIAGELSDGGLDYDIFGVSYYTYWHGTQENLTNVLSSVTETYGVKTCVMETSYMYTDEDGDGFSNSCSAADEVEGYPCTVQGQANNLRDVMADTVAGGGIGVFYWEGAWVPVADEKDWETNGAGWASSYSAEYDASDAGQYYGGSSWDNQALFDFTGKALPSLDVFKYVNYGAVGTGLEVMGVENVSLELGVGTELALPDSVTAYYNDSSCKDPVAVTWNADDVAAVDMNTASTYTVNGQTADGTAVTATIKVSTINYVQNPGFEEEDTSMWVITEDTAGTTDVQNKSSDAFSGTNALHFWSDSEVGFTAEQTISGLPAGTYTADVNIQGGDVGSDAEFYLYVKVGDKVYTSDNATLTGWVNWVTPTITGIEVDGSTDVVIGVSAKCAAGGWGTIDDFEFFPQN
jgi:arabinogalactan endo-1,4-beta-galactosidase